MIFTNARVAQLVEHHLAKVDVASSNLVSRPEKKPLFYNGGFLFIKVFLVVTPIQPYIKYMLKRDTFLRDILLFLDI